MPTKIFVYGSLKRGYPNHELIAGQEYLGQARTENGYKLYEVVLPVLVIEGDDYIEGELYNCDDNAIFYLDRLEGHPALYTRLPVRVVGHNCVQSYVWTHKIDSLFQDCGRRWENQLWKDLCR